MNKSIFRKMFAKCLLPMALCMMFGLQSCLDEYAPGQYYTFTGQTVADFLRDDPEGRFTNFLYALDKAGILGEMDTYGSYTCFAPINDGFKEYFEAKHVGGMDELSKEQCETIAFTHIIVTDKEVGPIYCSNLSSGAPIGYPNMLERYLVYDADSVWVEETQSWRPKYNLNGSTIIVPDDSVSNGVVHTIEKCLNPSNKFLPDIMKEDPAISWFYAALEMTGMSDSLVAYQDFEYKEYMSKHQDLADTKGHDIKLGNETDQWKYPRERKFKFTAFAEPNTVMQAAGIDSIYGDVGLISFAKNVYDPSGSYRLDALLTPDQVRAGFYNDLDKSYLRARRDKDGNVVWDTLSGYTNRNHPLNKFVSYHLLPEELDYFTFNIISKEAGKEDSYTELFTEWSKMDIEDYYETMMPHSIMRISTPSNRKKFINRKGVQADAGEGKDFFPGVEIRQMSREPGLLNTQEDVKSAYLTANGRYHYINDMLVYDEDTRNKVLNTRIRFMGTTLSPDFINSGARGVYHAQNGPVFQFLTGYCKNIRMSEQTKAYVRYFCDVFDCPKGDEINLQGQFDYQVRLPSVPFTGTYELRISAYTMENAQNASDRGVVQFFIGEEDEVTGKIAYRPCGLPLDMGILKADPRIGNVTDDEIREEADLPEESKMTEEQLELFEDLKSTVDKQMHNRGYMKAMDSYSPQGRTLRSVANCIRMILITDNFQDNKYTWLRIRSVDEGDKVCAVGCLELVPKTIYDNEKFPEDRH